VMDRADEVGARQDEDIAVPLQVTRVLRETLAAEIGFGQLVSLDHCPHRSIEDEDAIVHERSQPRFAVRGSRFALGVS